MHDVFSRSTKKHPYAVAIITEAGKKILYSDLNLLSNHFANFLRAHKASVQSQPFVAVLAPVGIESIACILGILKIGCAYVPLDASSPVERLKKILESTKVDIIAVDPSLYDSFRELFRYPNLKQVILLGEKINKNDKKIVTYEDILHFSSEEPPTINQVSDDAAYILHSSGSTGIPKGIILTHRNARTFVDWMQKEFKLTQKDVVISRAPFKFDLSVFDIFNTFKAGACLVCFDWNKTRSAEQRHRDYVRLMSRERATFLYTTPSTFISLLHKGGLAETPLSLRTIMYAGEPFPPAQIRKLMHALPRTKVANIYGPTETNIITYYWIKQIPTEDTPIPLGYVVDDTEILIVSEGGDRICESDEIGEIWCRGGTVTLGYLGLQEQTAKSSVQSPFHPYPAKYWKTGDFGFRDSDGLLHYRGRRDHMVKVKGYRIELGEIENALAAHPDLDEFAVVAVPDEEYGNILYCFYSLLEKKILSPARLKIFLSTKVPKYMLPSRFIQRDELPKTSSGKIDRVQLTLEAKRG